MSTWRRASITACSVLALALVATGVAFSDDRGGPNLWVIGFLVALGLAVVGVFFVNRWWALLPGFTRVAAFWLAAIAASAMESGRYASPFPEEYIGAAFVFPVVIGIAVLSVGLLARAVWDHLIRPNLPKRAGTKEAVR